MDSQCSTFFQRHIIVITTIISLITAINYAFSFGLNNISFWIEFVSHLPLKEWLPTLIMAIVYILISLSPIIGLLTKKAWLFWPFFILMASHIALQCYHIIIDIKFNDSEVDTSVVVVRILKIIIAALFLHVAIKVYLFIKNIQKTTSNSSGREADNKEGDDLAATTAMALI